MYFMVRQLDIFWSNWLYIEATLHTGINTDTQRETQNTFIYEAEP